MSTKKKTTKKATKKATKKKVTKKATKKVTKKVVKKKVSICDSVKKVFSKNKTKKLSIIQADGEQCFWATDGVVISNLKELEEALATMSPEVFNYHVDKERNDFAEWVEYVLKDKDLAKSLRKSKNPKAAHTAIVKRLKAYKA